MFILTNCPTTQLVSLQIEGEVVTVYEGIEGQVEELERLAGVVVDPEEITALIGWCASDDEPVPGAFSIVSFVIATSVVEVGFSVVQPSFTASYSDTPDTASLADNDGNPSKDVSSTPTAFNSNFIFLKTANNSQVRFTLAATKGAETGSLGASLYWRSRAFYGIGGAALLTEAQIEALVGNPLSTGFARTFSVDAPGASDYVWYCFPQSFDPGDVATFQVGVFPGGFAKVGVVSVTNVNGVTQNYACWRSDFPALGSITVQVY